MPTRNTFIYVLCVFIGIDISWVKCYENFIKHDLLIWIFKDVMSWVSWESALCDLNWPLHLFTCITSIFSICVHDVRLCFMKSALWDLNQTSHGFVCIKRVYCTYIYDIKYVDTWYNYIGLCSVMSSVRKNKILQSILLFDTLKALDSVTESLHTCIS